MSDALPFYPRDMTGYGRTPPQPHWPGAARLALQMVINYEEGGENCILHGEAGCGVAYKSTLDISQELARGHLIRLCPQWQGEPAPLNLVCADRRQLSPTVRALHQFLVSQLRD